VGFVYQNGSILENAAAQVSADDHGLLFGLGFFETFRTSAGRPHLWDLHRRRLEQACVVAGIEPGSTLLISDEAKLRVVIRTLLAKHGLTDAVFRYTLTAGTPKDEDGHAPYSNPAELLSLRPLPPAAPPHGVALRLLELPRDTGEWRPRPKSLNYGNALMGGLELRRRGAAASDEGLFLTRDSRRVVEGVRHNLAWLRDGRWFYPDPELGAVPGTCLQWLLEHGFPAEPTRSSLADFLHADAVVVINSVRGATPVRELWDVDDRATLATWASSAHPLVIGLRRRWDEGLQATAESGGR
jgi:4-amino-4-deoxychorismate lyase